MSSAGAPGPEEARELTKITARRIAHATTLIEWDDTRILTDPWFSVRPGYDPGERQGIELERLPELSAAIITHRHYDHADLDTFRRYPRTDLPIITGTADAHLPGAHGFPNARALATWESVRIGPVTITAAPGKHGVPESTYVLQGNGRTVYFGGDTLWIPELAEVARRFPSIDLALLPVNGLTIRPMFNRQVVMTDQEAAILASQLRPRVAVPIHYRFTAGWWRDHLLLRYRGTAEGFREHARARAPSTEVRLLEPGDPIEI